MNFFATRIITALLRAYTSYFSLIFMCVPDFATSKEKKRKSKKSFFHPKDKLLKKTFIAGVQFWWQKIYFSYHPPV